MELDFRPPDTLSEKACRIWRQVVPRRCRSPERLALLIVALESLDRADAARAVVEAEGMTTKTKSSGAVHVHPLLKVEKEARMQFIRVWSELNLGFCHELDGPNLAAVLRDNDCTGFDGMQTEEAKPRMEDFLA